MRHSNITRLLLSIFYILFFVALVFGRGDYYKGAATVTAGESTTTIGCDGVPADEDSVTTYLYSYVYDEASPQTGYISKIEIRFNTITQPNGFIFCVLSKNVAVFTDEDCITINGLSSYDTVLIEGTDYSSEALQISSGEYFGFYTPTNMAVERDDDDSDPGPGYWYFNGQALDDGGDGDTFTESATTRNIQIRTTIRY